MDYPVTSADTGLDREVRMTLRGLDDFLPDVVHLLPRCDEEITVRKALCETATQFCRDTGAFTYTVTLDMVTDTKRYALAFPWPSDLLMVNEVRKYSVNAGVETLEAVLLPQTHFYVDDPDDTENAYLNLWAALNGSGSVTYRLKVDVSLLPYFDEMIGTQAYALPEKFMRRWRGVIVAGTLAGLMAMDAKPWTDKATAADKRRDYDNGKAEAISKVALAKMVRGGTNCYNPIPWC